jgi:hypothetical protein
MIAIPKPRHAPWMRGAALARGSKGFGALESIVNKINTLSTNWFLTFLLCKIVIIKTLLLTTLLTKNLF